MTIEEREIIRLEINECTSGIAELNFLLQRSPFENQLSIGEQISDLQEELENLQLREAELKFLDEVMPEDEMLIHSIWEPEKELEEELDVTLDLIPQYA